MAVHSFAPTETSAIQPTPIDGLWYVPITRHQDERGCYAEVARVPELTAATGQIFNVLQINHSRSNQDVIRGIHAENWRKLIWVSAGSAFCAWVDLRPSSSTFKDVVTAHMGMDDSNLIDGAFLLEPGIGNSFLVTKGPLDYLYAVDQIYAQRDTSGDIAVSLFDPDLAIPWPEQKEKMIISKRDQSALTVNQWLNRE